MARPTGRPIRDEVVEAACTMVQAVGVNALSYGALAAQLGISAPSIHHHFRTKDDLVAEVARRYRARFGDRVAAIGATTTVECIRAYAQLFDDTSSEELMCFCGAVSSEWRAVGRQAQGEVAGFFADQVAWVTQQLEVGERSGELRLSGDAALVAQAVVSALEGAMLLARAGGERGLPASVGEVLVASLVA